MSTVYKSYLLRQLGIKESSIKPSDINRDEYPGIDPDELLAGANDEAGEHGMDKKNAVKTAVQHLEQPKQGHYYSGMEKAKDQGMLKDTMVSPTAISTPVIAMAVRGSSTGGLPSGADRTMSGPNIDGINVQNLSKGKLGGYEPISIARDNSELVDKTPQNPGINSSSPISDSSTTEQEPHPFQQAQGEPPQSVTGAATDGDSGPLKLGMGMPDGIDIDIAEGEDEDNNSSNPEFMEKDKNQFRKDRSESPQGNDVRKHLGMNETFARHLKLMNESLGLDECSCGPNCTCKSMGECKSCGCGKLNTTHDLKEEYVKIKTTQRPPGIGGINFDTLYSYGWSDNMALPVVKSEIRGKTVKLPNGKSMFLHNNEIEQLHENKHKAGCKCGFCANKGGFGKKKKENEDVEPAPTDKEDKDKKLIVDKDKKESVKETYSAPFEKMRGLANLGERKVSRSGIWESHSPGAEQPFNTNWEMNKNKAGMEKIDEQKFRSIRESLSKKKALSQKESLLCQKIDEILNKRCSK